MDSFMPGLLPQYYSVKPIDITAHTAVCSLNAALLPTL